MSSLVPSSPRNFIPPLIRWRGKQKHTMAGIMPVIPGKGDGWWRRFIRGGAPYPDLFFTGKARNFPSTHRSLLSLPTTTKAVFCRGVTKHALYRSSPVHGGPRARIPATARRLTPPHPGATGARERGDNLVSVRLLYGCSYRPFTPAICETRRILFAPICTRSPALPWCTFHLPHRRGFWRGAKEQGWARD